LEHIGNKIADQIYAGHEDSGFGGNKPEGGIKNEGGDDGGKETV